MTDKVLLNSGYKEFEVPAFSPYANRFYQKNGKKPIKMTNFDLYQHSIKLLKLVKAEITKSEGFGNNSREE